jgi:hypothetical protein
MTGNTLAATHLPVGGLAARWVFFRKKNWRQRDWRPVCFLKKNSCRMAVRYIFYFLKNMVYD